ncbi:helicase-related protein [Pyrococcus kukulkanii]|uniref:helicase-related protein n=1 Tax=Pyrococcus kukulkanii TaxID=1609559 RepID=UPI0035618FF3
MNLPEVLLREIVLHSPNLFYLSLTRPGAREIIPFLHQFQPLYHAMVQRPIRMLIADEIGLGKTIQALAIARYLYVKGEVRRALILVPKILREQWKEEVMRVGLIPVVIESGSEVEMKLKKREGFFIVSIDLAKMPEHREKFLSVDWDLVIVDEVHNVTLGTQRYEFVRALVERKDLNVIFLSATPHRGDPRDYLSRIILLDPTLVEDHSRLDSSEFYNKAMGTIVFRRTKPMVNKLEGKNVFKKCWFGAVVVGITEEEREYFRKLNTLLFELTKDMPKNSPQALLAVLLNKRASSSYVSAMETLSRIVHGIASKSEVPPENVEKYIEKLFGLGYEDIDLEDAQEYDEIVNKIIEKYSPILSKGQLKKLEELLNLAKEIKESEKDSKLKVVASLIKYHVERGEKVIVFTEFKDTLEYLKRYLPKLAGLDDREVSVLYGGMSPKDIEQEISKFESEGKLLISTDVASEGLNLQVASVLINYEAPWSPIKLEQRVGRIWRISQKRDVKAYTIFLDSEIDMYVLDNLYGKIMNIREAIGSGPKVGAPVLAEKILGGDFENIWKDIPGDFEGRERVTEYDIGYAIVKREVEGYRRAILNTLRILRQNMGIAVPIEKIENIKRELRDVIDEFDDEKVVKILRDYLKVLLKKNAPNPTPILHGITSYSKENSIPRVSIGVRKHNGELFFIKIVDNGKDIHRIPVVVSNGKVFYGVKLLEWLIEALKDGYEVLGPVNPKSPTGKLVGMARDRFYRIRGKYENYESWLIRKQLKKGKLFRKTRIVVEKIAEFKPIGKKLEVARIIPLPILEMLGLSEDDIEFPSGEYGFIFQRNFVPLEDILKAEKKAMKIVMELESRRLREEYGDTGWEVKDVSLHEHYDILVKTQEGEKYIEVKGHLPLFLHAELTEAEINFAKENKDKYWIYIVANIKKRPIIVKVFRPFDNPRIFLVNENEDVDITEYIKVNIRHKERAILSLTKSF